MIGTHTHAHTHLRAEECSGVAHIGHEEFAVIHQSSHHCGATLDEVVKATNLSYLGGEHAKSHAGISIGGLLLQREKKVWPGAM